LDRIACAFRVQSTHFITSGVTLLIGIVAVDILWLAITEQ
jgi:hypothetical protein